MQTTVIIDAPSVDWLTLTTYHKGAYEFAYRNLLGCAVATGVDVAPARRMQYQGVGNAFFFAGQADQAGRQHYLVQVWGSKAQTLGVDFIVDPDAGPHFKCTRIDIQWTSPRCYAVDLPSMGKRLRQAAPGEWRFAGRRPRVDIYDNQDEKHTLYVGSRSSDRFLRIYNKELSDGLHTRVEYEFKGSLAEAVRLQYLQEKGSSLGKILHSEWFCLPDAAAFFIPELADLKRLGGDRITADYLEPDLTATVNWVLSAVCPAVERLMKTRYNVEVAAALLSALALVNESPRMTEGINED